MPKDFRITISFTKNTMRTKSNAPVAALPMPDSTHRALTAAETALLESRGCHADDWAEVSVTDATDLRALRNVSFGKAVSLGRIEGGEGDRITDTRLEHTSVGDHPRISGTGLIRGMRIAEGVTIDRCGTISCQPEAMCGLGTEVAVLDETGSRSVIIYPGISAQAATLMARMPHLAEDRFHPMAKEHIASMHFDFEIGAGATIENCTIIEDVRIWPRVTVRGATRLSNGSVINNAPATAIPLARIGAGVDAESFIIEDGVADSGAVIRNTYIGQGAVLEKGFTSHDSLFFANSSMENGEACAVIAGPYSVSMHKSTLLIGCLTSFMNAGSATNQSNHMYKLGPVHWGILERGVKTSSNSYLMLGAKIGAFSLLMGDHKTHPDSSEFPFSYLFGDEKGSTVVVPAMMLRSCGLLRDEKKWPARDRRVKARVPMHDRIDFPVLNPHTVSHILKALDTIELLLGRPADDDRFVRYKGMKFSRASLERARMIYQLAIYKYLHNTLGSDPLPTAGAGTQPQRWIDLCGQLVSEEDIRKASQSLSIREMEFVFDQAASLYHAREQKWLASRFSQWWRDRQDRIPYEARRFDEMVEEDRMQYRDNLRAENEMLKLL